jgi:hypothetical protein
MLGFYEGVGVLKIEESESEVLKIEESESELLCTDSTALIESFSLKTYNILRLTNCENSFFPLRIFFIIICLQRSITVEVSPLIVVFGWLCVALRYPAKLF